MPETAADEEIAERTCGRCKMRTRWIVTEGDSDLPNNWIERDGQGYCLSCRRELAVETALEEMPEDAPAAGRAKIRSQAVVEFEINRDPDRRDGEIARAARCSVMAVSKARKRLGAPAPRR
ncbi:MAG: hypothetical protein ACR2K6_11070 [Solirubrobacterales bacterium]